MNVNAQFVSLMIKELRGRKSQGYINKKMEFGSNIVGKWESGRSRISWNDFLKFCHVCKVDIKEKIKNHFHYCGDVENSAILLTYLFGYKALAQLSRKSSISEMKLSRLFMGKSPLFLIDFLILLQSDSLFVLQSFLGQILSSDSLQRVLGETTSEQKVVQLTYRYPECAVILTALSMPRFSNLTLLKFTDRYKELGIQKMKLEFLVNQLIEHHLILIVAGKLCLDKRVCADDRGDQTGTVRVRKYWLHKAVDAIEKNSELSLEDKDSFGSIVFATNRETRQKIVSLYIKFFEEMKKVIVENKDKKDLLQVMSFQLFNPVNSFRE